MIASGSTPNTPEGIPGIEHCWTSDDVFTMEQVPKSMVALGSGYIGIEMSQIMQALGSQVVIVCRSSLLRGIVDPEITAVLKDNMYKLGTTCVTASPTKVEKLDSGMLRVHLDNGEHLDAEVVLNATGRKPNLDSLCLENAGV